MWGGTETNNLVSFGTHQECGLYLLGYFKDFAFEIEIIPNSQNIENASDKHSHTR